MSKKKEEYPSLQQGYGNEGKSLGTYLHTDEEAKVHYKSLLERKIITQEKYDFRMKQLEDGVDMEKYHKKWCEDAIKDMLEKGLIK